MNRSQTLKTDDFDLAILYWFYKEPKVTKNHLKLIRKHNPGCKIYGLFGGNPSEATVYRALLGALLDDFWTYPETYGADSYSKWIHGDLMLLDWYDKRGRNLAWDSIAITQWDMLLFTDIEYVVPGLQKNQVFFSGYRSLSRAIETRWDWTKPDGEHHKDYLAFHQYVASEYNYTKPLKCCLYIFEVLTPEFFELYLSLPDKYMGMLEYKDPTLAHLFGLDIHSHDIGVYWGDETQTLDSAPLNAASTMIPKTYVEHQLRKKGGWRLFHPCEQMWPLWAD